MEEIPLVGGTRVVLVGLASLVTLIKEPKILKDLSKTLKDLRKTLKDLQQNPSQNPQTS